MLISPQRWSPLLACLLLAACAAPLPLPFELVDSNNAIYKGVFNQADGSLEVSMGNKLYRGFYVMATGVATSTDIGFGYNRWGRYSAYGAFPAERMTIINSNNGRAHLQSADGDRLSCEFLFEPQRLIGECKSPQGKTYQMVANHVPPPAPKN